MPGLLPEIDPDGYLEYSVVYTDRSLNHMSARFVGVMQDISAMLKSAYNASSVAIVPGSGTFAMEAVARQIATGSTCLVIRNGWFSFRWTQILQMGHITDNVTVMKANRLGDGPQAPFEPCPIKEVVAAIELQKPSIVFAPHVETSSGVLLPDHYIEGVAKAAHDVGAVFVLDCIASGAIWVDMDAVGVDFLISAPQKGWTGPPCAGLVMMSESARRLVGETTSSSFAMDLAKWSEIMESFEAGNPAYHATMPTDALAAFRDVMTQAERAGFDHLKSQQQVLGDKCRALLSEAGYPSVAAPGFGAPGVVVSYTSDPEIRSGMKFKARGLQIAPGVPLRCDEGDDFSTFRIGLFGLDKLLNVERTLGTLGEALAKL